MREIQRWVAGSSLVQAGFSSLGRILARPDKRPLAQLLAGGLGLDALKLNLGCPRSLAVRDRGESGRQSCLKMDWFSGNGVLEFQKLGVQQISSIAGETREIFERLAG